MVQFDLFLIEILQISLHVGRRLNDIIFTSVVKVHVSFILSSCTITRLLICSITCMESSYEYASTYSVCLETKKLSLIRYIIPQFLITKNKNKKKNKKKRRMSILTHITAHVCTASALIHDASVHICKIY